MVRWYTLENNIPVPLSGIEEFIKREQESLSNYVVKQQHVGNIYISTLFLGFDHSWGDAPKPILWETMIFGSKYGFYQDRYSTYDEALKGHKAAVELARRERYGVLYYICSRVLNWISMRFKH